MAKKHRVRGHHRWQHYGKEAAEKKLLWIKPYWKGMSFAEALERHYIVR